MRQNILGIPAGMKNQDAEKEIVLLTLHGLQALWVELFSLIK